MKILKSKLQALEKLLKNSKNIAIFTHSGVDPDAQGSAFGTYFILKENFHDKNIKVFLYEPPIDHMKTYKGFKPYQSFEKSVRCIKKRDLVIIVDISDSLQRILRDKDKEPQFREILNTKKVILIDHHTVNSLDPLHQNSLVFRYTEPSAAEIVTEIFKRLKYKFSNDAIINLMTGIIADTRGLRYTSTKQYKTATRLAFLMKTYKGKFELRSIYDAIEEKLPQECISAFNLVVKNTLIKDKWAISYLPRDLCKTPEVARPLKAFVLYKYLALLIGIEQYVFIYPALSEQNTWTISFRSNGLNLAELAIKLGGGGHNNAASARMEAKTGKEVFDKIVKFLGL